jgi:hypothetical protein
VDCLGNTLYCEDDLDDEEESRYITPPEDAVPIMQPVEGVNRYEAREEDLLYYHVGDTIYHAYGIPAGATWEQAIRLTPTELSGYDGWNLTEVGFYHYTAYQTSHTGQIKIYDEGTDTAAGSLLANEYFTVFNSGMVYIPLSNPVLIDASKDIWVSVEINQLPGDYCMVTDDGPLAAGKGDFYSSTGGVTWTSLGTGYNWFVEAVVNYTAPPPPPPPPPPKKYHRVQPDPLS